MAISVHLDSLAADGAALADGQTGESPPELVPASPHSVSVGVAAQLSAHSASLTALINHGRQVRNEGGAAVQNAAATLRAADEAGAAAIAGNASMSGAVSAPPTPASVPDPVLRGIPPMPPLATMPGEAHAAALHSGPGSAPLREFADHWKSQAATLQNIATDTAHTSASIDVNWSSDHGQQAGANAAKNSMWWSDLAGQARALASAATDAADNHDQTVATTPHPTKDFVPAHNRLDQAIQANAASHGLLSGQVSAAAAHLALLQSQAATAATAHQTASSATTSAIPGPGPVAPPIATGSGAGTPACQGGTGNANQNTGGVNQNTGGALSAQPGLTSGLTTAATGAGSTNQMAQGLQSILPMLPLLAMAPMSALSGLSGLSQNNPSNMAAAAGLPGAMMADAGLPGDLADTVPAGAGGGADATAGVAQALPMSSPTGPTAPAPPAGYGPATSVGISAEAAGTAPAGAAGSGMSTYPPMMGAPGMGDHGPQRNVRLFPDRRMVWRPVPNTEAVFGELQRERRPRGKRATPEATSEEGANEG